MLIFSLFNKVAVIMFYSLHKAWLAFRIQLYNWIQFQFYLLSDFNKMSVFTCTK